MRIPGLGGEALRKLGATIVNLPSHTTMENYGSEKMASIISHQHPDHD